MFKAGYINIKGGTSIRKRVLDTRALYMMTLLNNGGGNGLTRFSPL